MKKLDFELLEELQQCGVRYTIVSQRDGFVMIKVCINDETWIIWIRNSPITEKAYVLAKKILNKHKYDKLIITRINEKIADHISFKELNELKAEILQFQQLKQTICETSS